MILFTEGEGSPPAEEAVTDGLQGEAAEQIPDRAVSEVMNQMIVLNPALILTV